jgi:beta-xylosidase
MCQWIIFKPNMHLNDGQLKINTAMKIPYVLAPLLPVAWCAGLGHTIHNPIIPGWNPDPAVLRVGNEYFIATSSMEYWPGIPIYRSTDLENWELYSHALTRPEQLQLYGTPTSGGMYLR